MRRIVIGLGTGRCGTQTLTKLFNLQPKMKAHHEVFFLDWRPNIRLAYQVLMYLLSNLSSAKIVSDVAFYWINYVDEIVNHVPNIRFVCLWRDREEVVESFCNSMKDRNLWTARTSEHWDSNTKYMIDIMALSFPKYDLPKREAIGKYWDEYNRKAIAYAEMYPSNFSYFPVASLNSEEGQRKILSFIKIPKAEQVVKVGLKLNVMGKVLVDVEKINPQYKKMGIIYQCSSCGEDAAYTVKVLTSGIVFNTCDNCKDKSIARFTI